MRYAIFAILIALSGCGANADDPPAAPADNHGFGFEFTAVSKGGLKLRQAGAMQSDADLMEAIAVGVEICSGLDAPPPPFVIVVQRGAVPNDSQGRAQQAMYFSNQPLILLDEAWVSVGYPHEVLHYLLDATTGNPDAAHQNPLFAKCVLSFPH